MATISVKELVVIGDEAPVTTWAEFTPAGPVGPVGPVCPVNPVGPIGSEPNSTASSSSFILRYFPA